ncbi:stage III sporulation protein AA [Paenibacillus sp. y28]|uniref:stage III sporulation protein AA n=1 Tax=Paenibacillus sp. y28 TaxID=3129110 RepID=UPI00301A257E
METLLALLPQPLHPLLLRLPASVLASMEEIRIRENRPLELIDAAGYRFVSPQGELLIEPDRAYRVTREDIRQLLERVTKHSLYTFEEELRRGYITIEGGHRIGLGGRTVLEHGQVKLIRDISSFNLRIARQRLGIGQSVLPVLWDEAHCSVHHTLVLSPPQLGKTTLLRDLARMISSGGWQSEQADQANSARTAPMGPSFRISTGHRRQEQPAECLRPPGLKVGIVDERSEIAACVKGVPRFDVGPRTDVLDGCPKAEGMMMMLRSLSPDVLVVDEIGRAEDVQAIRDAASAGIRLLATAHASSFEEAMERPFLRELLVPPLFGRIVLIHRHGQRRHGEDEASRSYTVLSGAGGEIGPHRIHAGKQAGIQW